MEDDEVLLDLEDLEAFVPPKRGRRSKKHLFRKMESSSSSSEDETKIDMRTFSEDKFFRNRPLARSRELDHADLEVIVLDDEDSGEYDSLLCIDEEEDGEAKEALQPLTIEQVKSLSDSEKSRLDWLTRVMPSDVLRRIYSHLDAPTADRTATVCHRTNDLMQTEDVWKVYHSEWRHVTPSRFKRLGGSRKGYAACYNYEMAEREKERLRVERLEYDRWLASQSVFAKGIMQVFLFNRAMDYLSIFCILLGTIFAAARCQETINWNWRIVLFPFYVPLLQLLVAPLAYDLCKWFYTPRNIDKVTESYVALWHGIFVNNASKSYRPLLYINNFALLSFWIMLMVRLNDNMDGMPAGPLAIPWMLLIVAIALDNLFGLFSGNSWSEGYGADRLYMIAACCISEVAVLFIVLKLDKVIAWNWIFVLTPVWVLFGLTILYPLVIFSFIVFCRYGDGESMFSDASCFRKPFLVYVTFTAVVLAPIFTWILLTALNAIGHAHRSWNVVFVPLFALECVILGMCFFLDFVFWLDGR